MSATTQAKEKAQETAQQAAGEARGRVREQVDQRSTDAGRQVSGTATDARDIAQQLREQGKEGPAKLAEQAADRAERLGDYLQNSDADRILSDVEDFGRRQPLAIMLGGLALGFAASRFLKASSTRRHSAGYSTTGTATGRGYATTPAPAPMPPTPTPGAGAAGPTTGTAPGAGLERERFGGDTPPVSERTGAVPPSTPARDVSLSGGVRHDGPNGPERPL
jgi:hypothetical protein